MSLLDSPYKNYSILLSTTAAVSVTLAVFVYQKWKRNQPPSTWEEVGKVTQLYIYPLKSGKRIPLEQVECTKYGSRQTPTSNNVYQLRDRELVVYDTQNYEIKTAKTTSKLVFIEIGAHDLDHFILYAPGMETLYVKIPNPKEAPVVSITGLKYEKLQALDCGDDAAEWLSRYLLQKDSGFRLGYHGGLFRRDIEKVHNKTLKFYKAFKNEAAGMFSNITSYNILNERSVEDLVKRIGNNSVTLHNFRPTIVITTEPFAEDEFDWVKIGDVVFRLTKPCTRCALTTVDQETGEGNKNGDPLKTLRTYRYLEDKELRRLENNSPVMGGYYGIERTGVISLGNTVYAYRDPNHVVIHK